MPRQGLGEGCSDREGSRQAKAPKQESGWELAHGPARALAAEKEKGQGGRKKEVEASGEKASTRWKALQKNIMWNEGTDSC